MENIQQRETYGHFLRFSGICQLRCGVLTTKDDLLSKDNHECLEKCTSHIVDSFKKVQSAYK